MGEVHSGVRTWNRESTMSRPRVMSCWSSLKSWSASIPRHRPEWLVCPLLPPERGAADGREEGRAARPDEVEDGGGAAGAEGGGEEGRTEGVRELGRGARPEEAEDGGGV